MDCCILSLYAFSVLYRGKGNKQKNTTVFSASIVKTGLANAHFYRYTVQKAP